MMLNLQAFSGLIHVVEDGYKFPNGLVVTRGTATTDGRHVFMVKEDLDDLKRAQEEDRT